MTPRVYRSTYFWTDEAELRRAFALAPSSAPTVVDVAAGPNTAPAAVLASQAPGALYIPLDPEPRHLRLLREALGGRTRPVRARGSRLPFRRGSVDVVLYHHGIDDVYETEGREGLRRSLGEAWRVIRPGGLVVASHCVFSYDEASRTVSLDEVEEELGRRGAEVVLRRAASRMDWLILRRPAAPSATL